MYLCIVSAKNQLCGSSVLHKTGRHLLFNVFSFHDTFVHFSQIEEVLLYSLGVAYYSYPEDPDFHGISGHVRGCPMNLFVFCMLSYQSELILRAVIYFAFKNKLSARYHFSDNSSSLKLLTAGHEHHQAL